MSRRYNELWFRYARDLAELRDFPLYNLEMACFQLLPPAVMKIVFEAHREAGVGSNLTKSAASLLLVMFYVESVSPSTITHPGVRSIASKLECLESRRTTKVVYAPADAILAVAEAAGAAA